MAVPTVEKARFAHEQHLERDSTIRDFCLAIQTGQPVSPLLAEKFDEGVRQIAARKALRMGESGEEVNDIVSAVITKFYDAIVRKAYRPIDAPVASYISNTTMWEIINARKRAGVRSRREVHDSQHTWADAQASVIKRPVEQITEARLTLAKITEEMKTLPIAQQQVIRKVPYFSAEEICSELGITGSELRNRLYRARKNLRMALQAL